MTGETLAWYRVASHLGMTVAEVQSKITDTEFVEWLAYLNWSEYRTTKEDYYFAQLTAEVVRTKYLAKDAAKIKDSTYLLRFVSKEETESMEERMRLSKSAWIAAAGGKYTPKKKK